MADMASTVQPDRNDADAASRMPGASRAGLMITPPPIPQIEPAADEKKQTSKMITSFIKSISLLNTSIATSIEKGEGNAISNDAFHMDFLAFMALAIFSISGRQASKNF